MGDKTLSKNVSRRGFVGAASASLAAMAAVGCSSENKLETTDSMEEAQAAEGFYVDEELSQNQGQWLPIFCDFNCGGQCVNRAYVVDGIVLRQKTDDLVEDSFATPQYRGCLRGRAQQQQCFNVNRLKYPMKRKNWEPLTGGKKGAARR